MKTELNVEGFHCKACEMLVQDVAEDFAQITSCFVDINNGKVVIEHSEEFNVNTFKKEIESLGDYTITK